LLTSHSLITTKVPFGDCSYGLVTTGVPFGDCSYGLVTAEVPFGDNHGLATPVPVMNILYVRASYWDVI